MRNHATRLNFAIAVVAVLDTVSAQIDQQDRTERLLQLVRHGSGLCLAHEWKSALASLDQAVALAPNDVEALRWRGHALLGSALYEPARADLDKALALGAEDAWTHYARAMALHHLGKLEDAIAGYTSALRIDPAFFKAQEWRGLTLSMIGDNVAALRDIDAALPYDRQNSWLYFIRAKALAALLDFQTAEVEFWRALDHDSNNADALAQLGYLHACAGRDDSAIGLLNRALAVDPLGQVEARLWLFHLLGDRGRTEEATDHLLAVRTAAAPTAAPEVVAWTALVAKFLEGSVSEAALLEAADANAKESASRRCSAFLHIGLLSRRSGRDPQALVALARAVAIDARDQWEWSLARAVLRKLGPGSTFDRPAKDTSTRATGK